MCIWRSEADPLLQNTLEIGFMFAPFALFTLVTKETIFSLSAFSTGKKKSYSSSTLLCLKRERREGWEVFKNVRHWIKV